MISNYDAHILESIPLGIIVTDLNGSIQTMNGYAESVMDIMGSAIRHQHIDTLFADQGIGPFGNLLRSGCPPETRVHKVEKNGKKLEIIGAPLKGGNGTVSGAVFTLRDITEVEKRQELEKKSEKYAAIGELSADIAHEIRNPLGSIELFASLLKKELKREKDINRVDQIIAAAKNVENKITELILSSQIYRIPVAYVNIHDILKDIMLFSERIIDQESVYLSVRYADIQPVVECNPDLMKQVFLNLILKALQTIHPPGRLDITTHHLPESQTIEIHFIDNSPCTRENMRLRIFDRSVHQKELTSALDLAIVHHIVNMYRGSIRIEFVEGTGTAFTISLPIINATMPRSGAKITNN